MWWLQVCDGNGYALGGIAGHAGLFSTAGDLWSLLSALMQARADDDHGRSTADPAASSGLLGPAAWRINGSTVREFTKMVNSTQSSRALGCDVWQFRFGLF